MLILFNTRESWWIYLHFINLYVFIYVALLKFTKILVHILIIIHIYVNQLKRINFLNFINGYRCYATLWLCVKSTLPPLLILCNYICACYSLMIIMYISLCAGNSNNRRTYCTYIILSLVISACKQVLVLVNHERLVDSSLHMKLNLCTYFNPLSFGRLMLHTQLHGKGCKSYYPNPRITRILRV